MTSETAAAKLESPDTPAARPPLTDSPWFWAHVFCVAALAGLAIVGTRADWRQGQLDRNFSARQSLHERKLTGTAAPDAVSADAGDQANGDVRWVDFRVFYALAGVGAIGSWVMLWRERRA